MKSGPSSDEVPDLLGALLKNRGVTSRRVLGGKRWFSRSGGRFTRCSCSLSQFWFHCGCFFYIYVSPELKGATEPSRAEPSGSDHLPLNIDREKQKTNKMCWEKYWNSLLHPGMFIYICIIYKKTNKTKTPSRRPHLGYIHWFLLPPPPLPPPSPVARHRRRRERCLREEKCPPMFTTSSNIEKTLEVRWAVWHFDR